MRCSASDVQNYTDVSLVPEASLINERTKPVHLLCFYVFRMSAYFHVCATACVFYPACFHPHFNDDEAVIATFVDGF